MKPIFLPILVYLLLGSTPCSGDTRTFNAVVIPISTTRIEQAQSLNFGLISNQVGALCQITPTGQLSGACISPDGTARAGQIIVSGLPANQTVSVKVDGSQNASLAFSPTADLNGAVSTIEQINNGQTRNFTTSRDAANIQLQIYGELEVRQTLPLGVTQSVEYSVSINIE